MITETKEDYLRALSKLEQERDEGVKSKELAEFLMLAKSTVSERLRELAEQNLIRQEPYGPITFTPKGRKIAQEITYKHRLVEVFLTEKLGMSKPKAHEEGHKIEHAISDEVARKLSAFLDNPKTCPHGREISR